MNILNFGSLNLDYVYTAEHFVRPGETLTARNLAVHSGGKGLNQSIALARAGAKPFHAGCVGVGGESLRRLLEENGVDVSHLREVTEQQGNAVIQVVPSGENGILLFGGSNRCVTPGQIDAALAHFGAGDYLLLQNEINELPYLVDAAYARGMKIILNPSPYDVQLDGVQFEKLAWLFVNEVEAEAIAGSRDPERAWERLHGRYPAVSLLVTLGAEGSAAWRVSGLETEMARQAAFPVRAVDTTAAGDTYTGYFIAGLMEGRPLAECMRRASMAAAVSVTRSGAAPSIPRREEVESALESAGR